MNPGKHPPFHVSETEKPAAPPRSPAMVQIDISGRTLIVAVTVLVVILAAFASDVFAHSSGGQPQNASAEQSTAPAAPDADTSVPPEVINYQGELTNPQGTPQAGTFNMTFKVYDAQSGGTALWSESHSVTTDSDGRFNALLGGSTAGLKEALAGGDRWLEIQVGNDTLTPRQRIGSVAYALHAGRAAAVARPGFITTILDHNNWIGSFASLAIGVDGLPVISYDDGTHDDLKVAHCNDIACTSAITTTVDSGGDVGKYTSIAIGADGLPVISYYDDTNDDLKVAHCNDAACSSATTTTVDSSGDVGKYTSIAIGADGYPIVGYYDDTNGDLKVVSCSNAACTTSTVATLDSGGDVGMYTSIAIGADGLPVISYYDNTNGDLKVAHCNDSACTSVSKTTVDSSGYVGTYTSIAIGVDGLPVIGYHDSTNKSLKVAHCNDAGCTASSVATVDTANSGSGLLSAGEYTSLSIGADGLPVISHLALITYGGNAYPYLRVTHCSNVACSTATSLTVSYLDHYAGYVYSHPTSLTIGVDGLPLISFFHGSGLDLRTLHCSNRFCVPYARP